MQKNNFQEDPLEKKENIKFTKECYVFRDLN